MRNPSSLSHIYRLGIVLFTALVVFLGIVWIATPASWNYDIGYWFRKDALEDLKKQPMVYGGITDISSSRRNQACKSCHKEETRRVKKLKHKALSCESCHGALADHVRDGKKFAAAKVDKSRGQCLNCHAEQINRPKTLPQFSKTGEIGKLVRKHKTLDDKTLCLKCHDAHDPTP